jgi:hypothetical protein
MMTIPFGKYKGQSCLSVAEIDPNYLHWMLQNCDLRADLEEEIEEALHEANQIPDQMREAQNW